MGISVIGNQERVARQVAIVLREILAGSKARTIPELREVLTARCGALRLRHDRAVIERALDIVSIRQSLTPAPRRPRAMPPLVVRDVPPAVARKMLGELGVSVAGGRLHQPKAVVRSADTPEFFSLVEFR